MKLHDQERTQFIKLFHAAGFENSDRRLAILDAFLETEQHVTARELKERLMAMGTPFSSEEIRETLKLLCRFGFAMERRFGIGQPRYEHRHLGHHHDHMICTQCHRIIEFKDDAIEAMQVAVAEKYGFHMLQHKMEFYGICRSCMENREHLMCLADARSGERLRIKSFAGGCKAESRLASMGLRVGDPLEVITNHGRGHVVVATGGRRIILGHGLSHKIMVIRRGGGQG